MEFNYNGHSKDSGIYKITNKLNGREYYGSAKEFKERWRHHAASLKAGKGANKFLQADFNKCGSDAFIFEVLEVTTGTKEERLVIEQTYIDKHHDGAINCYNFMKKAKVTREGIPAKDPELTRAKLRASSKAAWDRDNGSRAADISVKMKAYWELTNLNGGRVVTPETSKIMSEAGKLKWENYTDEERARLAPPVRYGKQSAEQIANRMATMKEHGHYDNISEETRHKMSLAKRKVFAPMDVTGPDGTIYPEISDLKAFSKEHGLNYNSVRESHRDKVPIIRGWSFGFLWIDPKLAKKSQRINAIANTQRANEARNINGKHPGISESELRVAGKRYHISTKKIIVSAAFFKCSVLEFLDKHVIMPYSF